MCVGDNDTNPVQFNFSKREFPKLSTLILQLNHNYSFLIDMLIKTIGRLKLILIAYNQRVVVRLKLKFQINDVINQQTVPQRETFKKCIDQSNERTNETKEFKSQDLFYFVAFTLFSFVSTSSSPPSPLPPPPPYFYYFSCSGCCKFCTKCNESISSTKLLCISLRISAFV